MYACDVKYTASTGVDKRMLSSEAVFRSPLFICGQQGTGRTNLYLCPCMPICQRINVVCSILMHGASRTLKPCWSWMTLN